MLLGIAFSGGTWLLLAAKGDWAGAVAEFKEVVRELNRLEGLVPYPNGENLRSFKTEVRDYSDSLARLKGELKIHVLPIEPIQPNEFQNRLRLALTGVTEKARATKVRLPEHFYLGFDEFAAGLPNALAAPLLAQELAQVESLLDILFEARVDGLTSFRRMPLLQEQGTVLIPTSASSKTGPIQKTAGNALERNLIEISFASTATAARKVLNQIVASKQFFVIRLLHVQNEKEKGPPREVTPDGSGLHGAALSESVNPSESRPNGPLNFIVGDEHIQVTARIEIVRFTF